MNRTFLALFFILTLVTSCDQGTSNSNSTPTQSTNPLSPSPTPIPGVTPTPPTPTPPTPGSCTGCLYGCAGDPGVADAGQTIEYYRINGESIIAHGAPTGEIVWSSETDLPSGYNQNSFYTDARFRIRVIPKRVNSDPQGPTPLQDSKGATCEFNNPGMAFTKMRIGVVVRRREDAPGNGFYHQFDNVSVDCPSQPYSFPIPQNSAYPLVFEIKNVEWDYTCTSYLASGYYTREQLEAYGVCPYAKVWDKECYELELEVATDDTKDFYLP